MGGIPWTKEEDQLLRKCIEQYGEGKWHRVPLLAGLNRCRKSCRLRWLNYLRPNIKRGSFEEEEIDLIIKLQKLLGNRWSLVAARLPGRTGNDVKNYWNCHLSKKLNAQEAEDKNKHCARNVQVMRPRASNYASTNSKRPYSTALDQAPSNNFCQPVNLLQEGGSSSRTLIPTPMPMLCNIGDGQNQMFQAEHDESNKNVPSVEEEDINDGINMGDFPMEGLPFKGVGEHDQDDDPADDDGVNKHNKWEWDDSILGDVDLWTHC